MWLQALGVARWWETVLGTALGFAAGVRMVLPWRSTAEAAKVERDTLRETTDRLERQNEQQAKEIAELKKTDLKIVVMNQTSIIRTLEVLNTSIQGLNANVSMIGETFIEHAANDKVFFSQLKDGMDALANRINGGSK